MSKYVRGAVYRCAERLGYIKYTAPRLLEVTSDDCGIVFLVNTGEDEIRGEVVDYLSQFEDGSRVVLEERDERLGGPGSVNVGVKAVRKLFGSDHIMICDEDVLACPPLDDGTTWDEALSEMLFAGWKVASHPCKETRWENGVDRVIGGVKGKAFRHVGGAFSSFNYQDWKKVGGVPDDHRLFGYDGPFQGLVNPKRDKIGEYYPMMLMEHLDDPQHPMSKRTSEYFYWYKWIRPDQAEELEHEVGEEYR